MINEMRKINKKKSNKNQSNLDTSSDDDEDEEEEDIDDEEEPNRKKSEVETNDFMDLNNKTVLVALLKQINRLHETNTKIFRNLHDTKGKQKTAQTANKKLQERNSPTLTSRDEV